MPARFPGRPEILYGKPDVMLNIVSPRTCNRYFLAATTLLVALIPAMLPAATVVTVEPPEKSRMMQEIRLSGSLRAKQEAAVSVRVDGLVEQVNFEEGDQVHKGDILLRMDQKMASFALRQARAARMDAEARLREAHRLLTEASGLIDKRHISRSELETRQSNVSFAEAALLEARATEESQAELLARHRVPAPFDGFIVSKHTEAGEWITRGTAIFEMVNPEQVWLDLQAPQEYFSLTAQASEILIYPDSQPGLKIPGQVLTQVPASNNNARTFLLRIVPMEDVQLLPGTSATAVIRIPASSETLVIPQDALVRQPDGSYSVFTISRQQQKTLARRHNVRPGLRANGQVEILQGLTVESPVIVRGNEVLQDGDEVAVKSSRGKEHLR